MSTREADGSLIRIIVIVLAVLILFPMLMMVFAFPLMGLMGWWGGGIGPGGISPLWGIGMMLVWLLILIGIGYVLYRAVARGPFSVDDRAIEELRVAYARGDLSDEEYEQRREALEQSK
jgi:putative membrane protein